MTITALLLIVIGIVYGGLSIIAIGTSIITKKNKLNTWSNIMMIIGSLLIIISVICRVILKSHLIYLLITGLILVHVVAINNGLKMYGKIHLKHHIIRLIISLLIMVLYLISY